MNTWTEEVVLEFEYHSPNDVDKDKRLTMRLRSDGVAYYVMGRASSKAGHDEFIFNYFLNEDSPVPPMGKDAFYADVEARVKKYNARVTSIIGTIEPGNTVLYISESA